MYTFWLVKGIYIYINILKIHVLFSFISSVFSFPVAETDWDDLVLLSFTQQLGFDPC